MEDIAAAGFVEADGNDDAMVDSVEGRINFEDAIAALSKRMEELSEVGSTGGMDDDFYYDFGLRFPPEPPEASCEVPECDGPDPSELWIDESDHRSLNDIWEGIVGIALVSLFIGIWWFGAEVVVGRSTLGLGFHRRWHWRSWSVTY